MKLTVNIKAMKKEGRTKESSKPSIGGCMGISYSSFGSGIQHEGKYVYAYNFVKHRKKSQRFGVSGKKLKKAKITPAKWVCYYYKIPIALLQEMNLKVVQGSRTFRVVDKWEVESK